MSDRLNELRRQRDIAQQQVEWFDREIARTAGTPASSAPATPVRPATPAPARDGEADAEKIIDRYRDSRGNVRDDVRRGCFLYFFAAFAILGLALFAWYYARRH